MAGKNFDISRFAEQLQSVSDSDHQEQITYIDIDQLDADTNNFYELSNVPDLASNIQLCGLQQPIRVRNGENGRYTIVSGHRRRAALAMLVGDGYETFKRVPCIIEQDGVSDAMRELRLIFANSSTRKMTPFELSQQAERVTALLYQLQEEGVEFPGRMRDQVAAACKTTSTKLAELKVIREKLQEPFQNQFRCNELNHSAAYALARLPADIQKDVDLALGAKAKPISGGAAENLLKYAATYYEVAASTQCPAGGNCGNLLGMLKGTAGSQYSWQYCEGKCCLNCCRSESCKGRCSEARMATKERAAKEAKRQEQQKLDNQKRSEAYKKKSAANARRLMPLIEKAGLTDSDSLTFDYSPIKVKEIRRYAESSSVDDYLYSERFIPSSPVNLCSMAKKLNCTADFLLGLTDEPKPCALPEGQLVIAGWMPGGTTPRTPCEVVAVFDLGNGNKMKGVYQWNGREFTFQKGGASIDMIPVKWMMLPPDEDEGGQHDENAAENPQG